MLIMEDELDCSNSDSTGDFGKEISVINYWLDNCQRTHPDCASSELDYMPTRVVDVGSVEGSGPHLVLTADLDSTDRRYLALSHCWGLTIPETATTTSSTLTERLQAIPLRGLSNTFGDFISIARRMQIRYVWIDSLCIIQDSREDWEREGARMASVYSNAYCTIAASSSANGNGGCRMDPKSEPYGPVVLSIDEPDEHGNTVVQKVHVFSLFGKAVTSILYQDPLTSRGWTFQERELSNKVLHYSKDSIRWECRSLKASLQFPWQDTNGFNGSLRTFDAGQIGPRDHTQLVHDKQVRKDEKAWFQAVYNYTNRALTKQSDVLVAFSGIARAVQARTRDRYLAGLWYSNLIHCLCWVSDWDPAGGEPIYNPGQMKPIHHARQSEYLAPSWSWACIKGRISYAWVNFDYIDSTPSPRAVAFMPQILEATTSPAGIDEFGQLKGGRIRIRGKAKPAFSKGNWPAQQGSERVYDMHEGNERAVGYIKYDTPSDSPLGQVKVIVCLCMIPRNDKCGDSVSLALVPTGMPDEFRRVGLLGNIQLTWYEENTVEGELVLV